MRFFIDKIKFIFFKKTYDALNRQAGLNKLFSGIGAAVIVADYAKEHMEAKITASMVNLEHLPELLTDSDQRARLVDQVKIGSRALFGRSKKPIAFATTLDSLIKQIRFSPQKLHRIATQPYQLALPSTDNSRSRFLLPLSAFQTHWSLH